MLFNLSRDEADPIYGMLKVSFSKRKFSQDESVCPLYCYRPKSQ